MNATHRRHQTRRRALKSVALAAPLALLLAPAAAHTGNYPTYRCDAGGAAS